MNDDVKTGSDENYKKRIFLCLLHLKRVKVEKF